MPWKNHFDFFWPLEAINAYLSLPKLYILCVNSDKKLNFFVWIVTLTPRSKTDLAFLSWTSWNPDLLIPKRELIKYWPCLLEYYFWTFLMTTFFVVLYVIFWVIFGWFFWCFELGHFPVSKAVLTQWALEQSTFNLVCM